MKRLFLISGIIAVVLANVFSSDTECIIGAVFLSAYAIIDHIDKKLKTKEDE